MINTTEKQIRTMSSIPVEVNSALDPAASAAHWLVSSAREHRHLSNLFTHLTDADWGKLERAIETLLSVDGEARIFDALETDILNLVCRQKGVSAGIFKEWVTVQFALLMGKDQCLVLLALWHEYANELSSQPVKFRKRALHIIASHGSGVDES